jgi:hypothetical protein
MIRQKVGSLIFSALSVLATQCGPVLRGTLTCEGIQTLRRTAQRRRLGEHSPIRDTEN